MSELTCLELSVLLWLAHVLTQAVIARGDLAMHICSRLATRSRSPKALLAAGRRARLATMSRITGHSSRWLSR